MTVDKSNHQNNARSSSGKPAGGLKLCLMSTTRFLTTSCFVVWKIGGAAAKFSQIPGSEHSTHAVIAVLDSQIGWLPWSWHLWQFQYLPLTTHAATNYFYATISSSILLLSTSLLTPATATTWGNARSQHRRRLILIQQQRRLGRPPVSRNPISYPRYSLKIWALLKSQ